MFNRIVEALPVGLLAGLIYSHIYLWFVVAGTSTSVRDTAPGAFMGAMVCLVIAVGLTLFFGQAAGRQGG